MVKGAIAGAGLYALAERFKNRRSSGRSDGPEVVGSRRHSGSYVEDEKYSDDASHDGRGRIWEDRLFKIGAPLGLAGALAWYYNRRHRDEYSDDGYDSPQHGRRHDGEVPINDGRYDGAGGRPPIGGPVAPNQPLPINQHPLNQPPQPGFQGGLPPPGYQTGLPPGQRPPHRPASSMSYSSYDSASNQRRTGGHGLRDGLATLGAVGLARSIWNKRKERKQDRQVEEEQNIRVNGNRLTGDGRPHRNRPPAVAESTLTTDSSSIGGHPGASHDVRPIPAGTFPGAAGAAAPGRSGRNTMEEMPLGGMPRYGQSQMPEIPPDRHGGLFHPDSSGSEVYIGADGRNHWRHSASHAGRDAAAAGLAGAAVGGIAAHEMGNRRRDRQESPSPLPPPAEAASNRRRDRRASASGEDSAGTPVSVKVKMHNDGRHVTLRRLPEAEAAAEREARRRSRDRTGAAGRNRGDSASSLGGSEGSTQRFRRNQALERQQADAMRVERENLAAARQQAQAQSNPNMPPNVPAPPPIPESGAGEAGRPVGGMSGLSVGSPGTYDGNTTEASADYANNRRRRRAERAQAKLAKEGKRVEFE